MSLERSFVSSCVVCFLVLFPALCSSEDTFVHSRATYYGSPDGLGTPSGACGYGEFGRNVYGGQVAVASSRLYRNGKGCGACYQVRCKIPELCTYNGANIVVTDYAQGNRTDFILSPRGFTKLARPKMAKQLMAYGVVAIEYKRISCRYPGHNLGIKVHEHSRFPEYLAIVILFQGGQKDIAAVELRQEGYDQKWRPMRNAYGAVWDMPNPPKGALSFRLLASDYDGQKWVHLRNVIPRYWKAGVAYDSSIQLY